MSVPRPSVALLRVAALVVGLVIGLAGCGGSEPAAKADSSAGTSPPAQVGTTPSATPTPAPRRPRVGQCYRLNLSAATSPTSDSAPVPCRSHHTTVTVFVGTIDPVVDGHLLAVDSKEVQGQIAATCPGKVPGWVGGSQDDRRLSRFAAIWFSPTLTESDAGADWFRCDVVAVAAKDQLAVLPGSVKGALDQGSSLDTFGTCGSSAPSDKAFQRVICARPHGWQAVSVVGIPTDAAYLGANAQAAGDGACKVQAQQRATDPLVYKWSFEWPTKAEWDSGRRYGLCWVPSGS